ncbi:MAG: Crp/Fnr family transcriptional regulator [Deltaproteobacteria bacterium]|nr:Crp/Fnr family transcriptional regulator [Deltaproteobacteria bacterium]
MGNDQEQRHDKPRTKGQGTPDCRDCRVCRSAEWGALTDAQWELLSSRRVFRRYPSGAVIHRQGEGCTGVFTVHSGTVALRKTDGMGHSVLLRLVPAGETFGYSDCYAGQDYSSSGEAMEPSGVCFLERKALNSLLAANQELSRRFQEHLIRDYNTAKEAILQQAWLPVRARLAHLLSRLREHFGRREGGEGTAITPPLTRQDMADLLGTRQETIARTLHAMEQDGVLVLRGRTILVPDLGRLEEEHSV